MLSAVVTMQSSMSNAGLDNQHRNKDGEISDKYGNTLVRTLLKFTDKVSPPAVRKPRN